MVRVIRSGKVEEKMCFPINPGTKTRRPKSRGSLPRKQDSNERDGIKRTARVINSNYQPGDLLITLNYDEPAYERIRAGNDDIDIIRGRADKEAEKFLRRLGYNMGKSGIEPVTMLFTSDMDGDTGEIVRCHHHLIIKAEGFEFRDSTIFCCGKDLKKIWKNGGVSLETLRDQPSYSQLAAYLYRQVRRSFAQPKYHGSRNLKKPVLISEKIVHSNRRLRLPKGAKLIHRSDSGYSPDGVQYLCYEIADKAEVRRGT